jgi:hypothetical protein
VEVKDRSPVIAVVILADSHCQLSGEENTALLEPEGDRFEHLL